LRVGIDGHMVGGQETGNETYVKGLVEGFRDLGDADLVVYHVGAPWASGDDHIRFERLTTANPVVRLGAELPIRSAREHLEVLHMTYATPIWSMPRVVVTVHDICYATNPEWFSRRDLYVLSATVPRSIRIAAHVITVSDDARGRIIERYNVPERKITAIANGPGGGAAAITKDEATAELAALRLSLGRPYILTVGNLQPRKNLVRLITAVAGLIHRHGHDVDLVVVGPKRFHGDAIVEAAAPLARRVHFTGYVSDRQLAASYRNCELFVLPSLYEGFGLPVIEAMAHGAPIACSNTGALPEVAGDVAVLFDPLSVEAMTEAMHRVLSDQALSRRLAAAAKARAGMFSWRRSAERTLEVYRRAME
jgi:glycosyltransferase involved in cell wall biosynthesis